MTDRNIGDQRRLWGRFWNAQNFLPTDVAIATEKITVTTHGFSDTDIVRFTTSGTLPAGLEADTDYYVVNKASNDFEVSATPGGTAIDLTSVGVGIHAVGTLTDPTTVTFSITEPNGTQTTYVNGTDAEAVKDSTGVYYVDWTITQAGRHYWKWAGAGTVITAEEESFTVRKSNA